MGLHAELGRHVRRHDRHQLLRPRLHLRRRPLQPGHHRPRRRRRPDPDEHDERSSYGTRGLNQASLILNTDSDADLVAASYEPFANPQIRVSQISLDGYTSSQRLQILSREIGDTIRVKARADTAEPIDILTRILGKHKTYTPGGNLTCTWNLSRGLDASDAHWHLGVTGYGALNSTTILAA